MSEYFWETLENILEAYGGLLTGDISPAYVARYAEKWARLIFLNTRALKNCIGFIDGTVIGIARPEGNRMQNEAYNEHKRKRSMKFQTITSPDGIIFQAFRPLEGCRHDWTLHVRYETDRQLESCYFVDGMQMCLYGDSGYNARAFLEVPFQGEAPSNPHKAFSKSTSGGRVIVEWMYMEVKLY